LIKSVEGYCEAFKSLCNIACKEHTMEPNQDQLALNGCAHTLANDIKKASAAC
jgi:hypothetical protein